MRAIGVALAAAVVLAGGGSASGRSETCPRDARLGKVAYVRGGALHVLDLGTCADRVLVRHGVSGPVRFVHGRLIRYGGNWAVSAAGGKPTRVPLETGMRSPDGRLVANVRVERRPGAPTGSQSIVVGGRVIYTVRESYRRVPAGAPGPLALVAWSPDSRWLLFYVDPMGSESLAADGIELRAIGAPGGKPHNVVRMLAYPDYIAWCGPRLVVTAGGSRIATENKWLALSTPPFRAVRRLVAGPPRAWGSIACASGGARLAAQSQPISHDANFFATRWSLWSIGLDGVRARLTAPPRGYADESPRWSRDGRSLLFVRSRRGVGALYLWRAGRIRGPLAKLGYSLGYFGHHDWWAAADWWQPARSRAAAASSSTSGRIAFLRRGDLVVADLATGRRRVALRHAGAGPIGWSGDGKLLSVGGRIVGGPTLTRGQLVWAPTGETAAYRTKTGAVFTWSPAIGRRLVVDASWGATSFAWGPRGELALGRSICHAPCGIPLHREVWLWRNGSLRRIVGPLPGQQTPRVAAVAGDGRVLWWSWLSASTAADGTALYADRAHLADTLVYSDFVDVCGHHLALVAGHDRFAMHGKRILLDSRDVSRDPYRSWVAPSCSPDGTTLVAAASVNTQPPRIGREHRSIWQLLPSRRRLTSPPAGWSDEFPRLQRDGSVVFVRTRSHSTRTALWGVGTVELLRGGKLRALGTAARASNYYGHYDWPDLVAVSP